MARGNLGGVIAWVLAGAAAGVAVGLYLGDTAAAQPARLRGLVRQRRSAPVRIGFLARLARQQLQAEPLLRGLSLRVLPVTSRTVELHGWVMTRTQRSIAQRAVTRVPGVDSIINRILVRGEDDLSPTDTPDSA